MRASLTVVGHPCMLNNKPYLLPLRTQDNRDVYHDGCLLVALDALSTGYTSTLRPSF